eukprot:3341714-Pleurochrysis_carterae.AAC.2
MSRVLESRSDEVLHEMRTSSDAAASSLLKRERFLAARWVVKELRDKYRTTENWLELRLKKCISMNVFKLGAKLFSRLMKVDGEWEAQILLVVPDLSRRAKRGMPFVVIYACLLRSARPRRSKSPWTTSCTLAAESAKSAKMAKAWPLTP